MSKLAMVRKNGPGHPHYRSRLEWVLCRLIDLPSSSSKLHDRVITGIVAQFDLDLLGYPLLVSRGTGKRKRFWVLDGKHRIAAVRKVIGQDQLIECEVLRGIPKGQETAVYLHTTRCGPGQRKQGGWKG